MPAPKPAAKVEPKPEPRPERRPAPPAEPRETPAPKRAPRPRREEPTIPGPVRDWMERCWNAAVAARPEREEAFETASGLPLAPTYALADENAAHSIGWPGEYPFTRGAYPSMYRGRFWTMRQYAGFTSARSTNERFRYLLEQGQTGLSVAFDLPTQIGYDSDDPLAEGEVGKVGVPINSIRDMERLLDGIPLDQVTISMTINATAPILLAMVVAVARKQGVPLAKLRGTIQNDILKEYAARGTYRFPVDPSMRMITDVFRFCADETPNWNTISISGYHMREAGCTAIQEIAFTLANGVAYVERAVAAGLDVDAFAPRLSFFFSCDNDFFEEIAKFRAARRLWAKIMRERFGAKDERSTMMRFHTQTGGSTLTSQQADNNVVRVTLQALAAVLGGTQSLHTNSRDEALGLPTEESARIALRTQQIIAHESGVANVVDPLGGAPFVETLTDELEQRASALVKRVDELGGAVEAIRSGWIRNEIHRAAYAHQQAVESGEKVVVGVNRYQVDETPPAPFKVDEEAQRELLADLADVRATRNGTAAIAALAELEISLGWGNVNNVMPLILNAVEAECTIGEICAALEKVFGKYEETA